MEVWSPSRSGFLHSYEENSEGRLNWKIMFALFLSLNHRLNPSPLQKTASCLFSSVTSTVLRKFSAICRGNSLQLTRLYKSFNQLLIHLSNRYAKQSSILERQIHPKTQHTTRNKKMLVSKVCWHLFLSASDSSVLMTSRDYLITSGEFNKNLDQNNGNKGSHSHFVFLG